MITDDCDCNERMIDLRSIGEKAMRSILALSLLITLCGSANAATVHPAHRRHAIVPPNQGMIYAPPPIRAAPKKNHNEPYFGASRVTRPAKKNDFSQCETKEIRRPFQRANGYSRGRRPAG